MADSVLPEQFLTAFPHDSKRQNFGVFCCIMHSFISSLHVPRYLSIHSTSYLRCWFPNPILILFMSVKARLMKHSTFNTFEFLNNFSILSSEECPSSYKGSHTNFWELVPSRCLCLVGRMARLNINIKLLYMCDNKPPGCWNYRVHDPKANADTFPCAENEFELSFERSEGFSTPWSCYTPALASALNRLRDVQSHRWSVLNGHCTMHTWEMDDNQAAIRSSDARETLTNFVHSVRGITYFSAIGVIGIG